MAVTPGYVGSAGITWAASATASVAGQSIGTATWDRIVVVAVTVEETATIDSCTIGGVTANVGISVRNTTGTPDNACAFFWLPVSTGTTATIAVTLSASSSLAGRISVWAMTGAHAALFDSNSAQGSAATQTLTGVTVNTGGAGFWVFNNATAGTAVTWTNATERDDTATATYRHSVADTTAAGTLTITADGATTNQILAGISFNEYPPAMGWDRTPPPNMMPIQTAAKVGFVASVASGMILAPYPYVQPEIPDFAHAQTTTNYIFARNLYYQAQIAPPPQAAPFVAPTTMDWQQPLSTVPPSTRPTRSQAIYAFPPPLERFSLFDVSSSYLSVKVLYYQDRFEAVAVVAEDNNQTIDKWLQPLSRAVPRPPVSSALYTPFVPKEATRENTQTPDQWLQRWDAPSRNLLPLPGGQPFISVKAPSITPDQWMRPFTSAVPALRLNVSQVTYAAAPVAEVNTRTEWDWPLAWNLAAKAPKPIHTQPFFGYPYVAASNLTTTLEWLRPWQGPPSYSPPTISAAPFVPREAVLENTITGLAWLPRWQGAVPTPPTWVTQPFFGYPYISAPTITTTLEWLRPWQGPPKYKPPQIAAQPFVPREAVRENTQTPDKWLKPLGVAAKRPPVRPTQPFFGYPYQAEDNTVTPDKWLTAWKGPPRYQPVKTYYQPWTPQAPVTVTAFSVFSVETMQVSTRALFYETYSILAPYPYTGVVADEGPADEHERIACVPLASRVAIVPELSRVVEVPFTDREQDSNEYRDRSCGTPALPVAAEPEVPTEESPFQEDTFQHEDDAFQ